MERVEVPQLHEHPLIPFTRFAFGNCKGCNSVVEDADYIYGGYRCNKLGCKLAEFHKECAKPLEEINHSSHPDHSLKLIILDSQPSTCSLCGRKFKVGYSCSICDFKLDLKCARRQIPLVLPENSYGHEHPLQLLYEVCDSRKTLKENCKVCDRPIFSWKRYYGCYRCEFFLHVDCVDLFEEAEAYHTSHPQHPLKSLKYEIPDYADDKCLLCEEAFDQEHHQLHHCDVCNFSICRACMKNPPPVDVQCPTTHEHQLQLFPRRLDFTCNACGTHGDRSPYLCLQCNFMIHRECIDLPRVININRHDHRISYTRRLGQGDWKCRVCRKIVDGIYGAYTCSKCPSFVVHSLCATRKNVWDKIELEGTDEEEEIAQFKVIDDKTIKHLSHDHNLRINKGGEIQHESIVCAACVLQICSEPFYSCLQCEFIIHKKCVELPLKKHVCDNQPITLRTDSHHIVACCSLCERMFTGFRYESDKDLVLDVRCGSTSESFVHDSHRHPLHYSTYSYSKRCRGCGERGNFSCDECDFSLDFKCALLPRKVISHLYDDHPLFLSYGETSVGGEYWCEACETKVNPQKWFYRCMDCQVILHISCVVGDLSFIMPGTVINSGLKVLSNTSTYRPLCAGCNSRCKLPSILKVAKAGKASVEAYFCSLQCLSKPHL